MSELRSFIKRMLPGPVFHIVRNLPYMIADSGPPAGTNLPIPRLRDHWDGPRGYEVFIRNGQEAFAFYRNVIGVEKNWNILDIGSGIGRKTLPLIPFLSNDGLYVGIDPNERGVKWCSDHISVANNRFVFFSMNIYNKMYNPFGKIKPEMMVLPFAKDGFDFTCLWSVFTHMYINDIERYLNEISRVLKPGGTIAASYFLMNSFSKAQLKAGVAEKSPVHALQDGHSWTENENIPEDLIAVDEQWLRNAYSNAGLEIREPIMYGRWCGNQVADEYENLNFQDIVVARKIG